MAIDATKLKQFNKATEGWSDAAKKQAYLQFFGVPMGSEEVEQEVVQPKVVLKKTKKSDAINIDSDWKGILILMLKRFLIHSLKHSARHIFHGK